MTNEEFRRLHYGDEVVTDEDENVYRVLDKDRMGRIKMKKVVWFYDPRGDAYDSFEEALDALHDEMADDDNFWFTESDIESSICREEDAFWMDYRHVYPTN